MLLRSVERKKRLSKYQILIREAKQEARAHRAAMTEKIEERQEVKKRLAEVSDIQRKATEMVQALHDQMAQLTQVARSDNQLAGRKRQNDEIS